MLIEGKIGEKDLKRSTTVENSLQINPFYAKQTQFQKCKMNVNTFSAMRYENLGTLMGQKTNPKQTQLKPKQTQSNPICRKAKNERFCVDMELYDELLYFTRGIKHPDGCQFDEK